MSVIQSDVIVIGGGIVGLAHTVEAVRRGKSVTLLERFSRAVGASIRNFGMLWPIGQPPGRLLDRALRSRRTWLELADQAGFWSQPCGSLHLAYESDEAAVLEEFVERYCDGRGGYDARIVSADEARERCPGVITAGLRCALWSATEAVVDPREAIGKITRWLVEERGVRVVTETAALRVESGSVAASDGNMYRADAIFVCGGDEFQMLYPEVFRSVPITRCKLQMMRTGPQPEGWRLGTHLAAGLTLLHYKAFAACESLAALRNRCEATMGEYLRDGIHVLVSQNGDGELIIGDTHEYGLTHDPFLREAMDERVLRYLRKFLLAPRMEIAQRWMGIYPKMLDGSTEFVHSPTAGVWIVNGLGGNGMTLSFGLAQDVWNSIEQRS